MKNIHPDDFKVTENFAITKVPTAFDLGTTNKQKKQALKETRKKLGALQDKMYANNRYSVLICLQGMDTSGKDSLIKHVFKDFNARGVVVSSFKKPSLDELRHDYLWRHYKALPDKGKFGVFNRSYYENVLVTRVHPEYLLNEHLPGIEEVKDIPDNFWQQRYKQINNFEEHLTQTGTIVFKFFLNIGKEEQRQRLLRRLDLESHNWKFDPADLEERELWDEYRNYYGEAINNTSKDNAPWYAIPADDKKTARLIVATILLEELQKYNFHEPDVNDEVAENIRAYKKALRDQAP
ncbi:PPK2 family polyphosphate kinase [Flavobacterium rhizosphaerae]|uniref:PPK2 family polyphosphate kinase n=1 Tax=Flavobacterium rhizosphaerae TaxID=3163298 RepID=A0ABW8YUS3_9FLAO